LYAGIVGDVLQTRHDRCLSSNMEGNVKRYATIAVLMGVAMLAQVSTASAQRWGRGATPQSGVCFYENINFGGRYFCTRVGQSTASVPPGMNDKISSVRVFGRAAVTVYRDPSFRGQSRFIDSNASDLRGLGFNDRISSYTVDAGRRGNRNRTANNGAYRAAPNRGRVATTGSQRSRQDAESLVRQSYRSVLGRDPDPSGLSSWTDQVVQNNWTQQDLENALRQSDEYRQRNNGNGNGVTRGDRRR
jgi:hypothetical protein